MTSLLINGGTLEIVIFVAGADSGVTGTNISLTHIPLTVNWLISDSVFKKTTTALFIREAETILSKPTCSPTTTSSSSIVTPGSGTHLHPFLSDRLGGVCPGIDAISASKIPRAHDRNFPLF